ncbi:MAG: T9SS type A sorting domain-containing protein [bacterium]|nr:T9SS type A sorting domain-containing protein [bacterium]
MRYIIICILLFASFAAAQEVLWQRDGDLVTSHFGAGIYPLGDQNDDGYADWAVWNSDEHGGDSTGLSFFYGGPNPSQTPYLRITGEQGDPYRRILLFKFCDFNGDGFTDWMISFWPYLSDTGYVKFYSGGVDADAVPEVVWTMAGFFNPNATTGEIGLIGDHNGDGYDDFYYYDSRPSDLTTVYLGSPTWDFQVSYVTQGEPIFSGESRPNDIYGDFNGDGFDDFPTQDAGVTKFYFGSAEPDTIPDLAWSGNFSINAMLEADLNDDQYDDLLVHRGESIVEVHMGAETPSEVATGNLEYGACPNVGHELHSAGDFNRDRYEDVIIINSACNGGFGRLALFVGGSYLRTTPVWEEDGTVNGLMVGICCATGVGDINGDGIEDLTVGCQNGFNRRGRVVIFSGDTTMILPAEEHQPIVDDFSLSIYPNPANGFVTIDVQPLSSSQPVEISIYSVQGREVDRLSLPWTSRSHFYDVSPLATGLYFLHATNGRKYLTPKLVVLK